ncbi:lactonase family protein [bacterium 19MO03SA05]|uniref:Lactonase family protein n=1 Tax=bacterium 19MO03SA05 TaxID=2920620 RepID=A0AAU6VDY4_UNCXX|nr:MULTISPECIES: lactonase family protein [unclassified Vibrio]EKO3567908.1 lactonase family protein [Vibrio metschnikovii]EKO3570983.1 lactonase family protein [Vibrio metschnikovii]EKO3586695.1 lactonase family protein [Vibrio metschnikovii]EKO3601609.1 lactonase family protein [Vibrio metschnikovii]EKO3763317.1 lactonase family protein [Vibrio metschnikovii]
MTLNGHLHFYVGTYTDSPSQSHGIACVSLDSTTGLLTINHDLVPDAMRTTRNPSYLTVTEHGLYTFNEVERLEGAELIFAENTDSYALPIEGDYPCYIDIKAPLLAVANYGSGNVSVYHIDEYGKPLKSIAELYVEGSGPNIARQASSHAHQATFLNHTKQLAVVDLGTDSVYFYDFENDGEACNFSLTQSVAMPAGSGPRHLVFNREESIAYVVCELSETLVVLCKHDEQWNLTQQVKLLADEENKEAASAIRLSADERFVYVSCRAQNVISTFDVTSNIPVQIAMSDCGGKFPRDFVLSRDGQWMLVANQHSNNVASFHRNPETGAITPTGYSCDVGAPVCLVEKQ